MFYLIKRKADAGNKTPLFTLIGKAILFIGFTAFVLPILAQQPFQDSKGESTIFIPDGGFAQINVADPSIRLGYLRNVSKDDWVYGFNLSGKLTANKAGLISNNKAVSDAQVNFTIGRNDPFTEKLDIDQILVSDHLQKQLQQLLQEKNLLKKNEILPKPKTAKNLIEYLGEVTEAGLLRGVDIGDILSLPELKKFAPKFSRILFQGGYSFKQYNLYDPTTTFDDQVYKKNFHSPSAQIIYFRQLTGRTLFGASVGVQRSNNSTDLTEIEVRDFTTIGDGSGTTREATRIRKALRGNYSESTKAFINTDFVWFPETLESRIGINFFTRSGLSGDQKGFRPGIGLFFSEQGSPTRVIGGVNFSIDEKGKSNLSLTAGYNF